ncbi:MAG TPA: ribbon-helix-helix domain-containing protein [Candidatus Angelobacter sp.]|nr:ribbon-helix-helix domain-containing protein [Candidatus Angelobacter sp.]
MTFNLPDEVVERLKQLAEEQHVSQTEALRRAISTEAFIRDERAGGPELVVGKPGAKPHRVRFTY